MTEAQLLKLVEKWKLILKLNHWRIEVDFDTACDPEANVSITRSKSYDNATIELAPSWKEWSEYDIEQRVVHELLHLTTREIDTIIFDLLPYELGPQVRSILEESYRHASEQMVDRLAHSFVELEHRTD